MRIYPERPYLFYGQSHFPTALVLGLEPKSGFANRTANFSLDH
jgi:hypothetical protein